MNTDDFYSLDSATLSTVPHEWHQSRAETNTKDTKPNAGILFPDWGADLWALKPCPDFSS